MKELFYKKFRVCLSLEECNSLYKILRAKKKDKMYSSEEIYSILYELYFQLFLDQNKSSIFERLENNLILFEHEGFKEEQLDVIEENSFIEKPPEIKEGLMECKFCKSYKTVSYERQTRSADEQATIYIKCLVCKRQSKV